MSLKQLQSYFNYLLFSWHRNGHGVHSPYLFKMVTESFRSARNAQAFFDEELVRQSLLHLKTTVKVSDFGAGSKSLGTERRVRDIARVSAVAPRYGRLLASLVQWTNARNVLELGTSVGIGSLYLSKYATGFLTTVDACQQTQNVAKQTLAHRTNCEFLTGRFTEILPNLAQQKRSFDVVYIDGNHTLKGTLENFEMVVPLVHDQSIVVFDDINWSSEMQQAWTKIKNDARVRVSIDLWQFGIILFRPEMNKENLVVRY